MELNRLGEGLNKRALYKIVAPFCSGIRSVGHADVCCNALIGLTECSTGNAGPQHLWPGLCDGSENDNCNGVMSLKLPCSCFLGNYIFRVHVFLCMLAVSVVSCHLGLVSLTISQTLIFIYLFIFNVGLFTGGPERTSCYFSPFSFWWTWVLFTSKFVPICGWV